jgi:hypothetical protein
MSRNTCIVLTGGPGGGKTTLIEELLGDPAWSVHIVALPETIFLLGQVGISPREKLFQRVMVHLQMALEDGLDHAFAQAGPRIILCHRGSLDPLAYWLDRGWPEEEFFSFTGTTWEEHYQRYAAVIHLVTAADGAEQHYTRWPEAHRPESIEEAAHLDSLLQQVWRGHPNYHRLDNKGCDWKSKSRAALKIITNYL